MHDDGGADSADRIGAEASQIAAEPFDLETGPLVRAHLWPAAPDGAVLVLVMHHIIADFWSFNLLLRELAASYQMHVGACADPVPAHPEPGSYDDFVAWQDGYVDSAAGRAARDYWLSELSGTLPQLAMPADRPRPPVQTFAGARHCFVLDAHLTGQLADLARAGRASLYTVLMAAFQVLLHRWTGQTDILVGSPSSGRTRSAHAGTAGYLVNPIVVRGRLTGDQPFRAVLSGFAEQTARSLAHQDYPFALLAEQLRTAHDPSRSPVFQAMLLFQQAPPGETGLALAAIGHHGARVELSGLVFEPLPVDQPTAQFDLTLALATGSGQLHGSFLYNTDLFDAATVERLTEAFRTLLASVVRDPGLPVGELTLISPADREQLIQLGNATARPLAEDAGVHQLFEAVAARQPDAVAVAGKDDRLTYRELDSLARQIAGQLQASGVVPGDLVGVCVERSPELIAALLGVLKAGAAYVPLDPGYPAERIALAITDTRPAVILASASTASLLPAGLPPVLTVAAPGADPAGIIEDLPWSAGATAYVLHTSGSTGTPKGVVVTHRNVLNFLAGIDERVACGPDDTVLAVTSVAFDISLLELLWPLTHGARIVLASDRAQGAGQPARAADRNARWTSACSTSPAPTSRALDTGWSPREPGSPTRTALPQCGHLSGIFTSSAGCIRTRPCSARRSPPLPSELPCGPAASSCRCMIPSG